MRKPRRRHAKPRRESARGTSTSRSHLGLDPGDGPDHLAGAMRSLFLASARVATGALVFAAAALGTPSARAQANASDPRPEPAKPYERRGGFMLAAVAGASLGSASGNPKGQTERFDPAYESNLGLAYGYRWTPFLGGALTDWFTVGVGMSFGTMQTAGDLDSDVTTFVFHFEAFPLYARGGAWRDVGVMADFGAGVTTIHNTVTGKELSNSAVASAAGLGVFWEPWRVWQLSAGPALSYQRNWSQWTERNDVTIGLRGAFYGAP